MELGNVWDWLAYGYVWYIVRFHQNICCPLFNRSNLTGLHSIVTPPPCSVREYFPPHWQQAWPRSLLRAIEYEQKWFIGLQQSLKGHCKVPSLFHFCNKIREGPERVHVFLLGPGMNKTRIRGAVDPQRTSSTSKKETCVVESHWAPEGLLLQQTSKSWLTPETPFLPCWPARWLNSQVLSSSGVSYSCEGWRSGVDTT